MRKWASVIAIAAIPQSLPVGAQEGCYPGYQCDDSGLLIFNDSEIAAAPLLMITTGRGIVGSAPSWTRGWMIGQYRPGQEVVGHWTHSSDGSGRFFRIVIGSHYGFISEEDVQSASLISPNITISLNDGYFEGWGWDIGGSRCYGGTYFFYEDGTYSVGDAFGSWAVDGRRLTITTEGETGDPLLPDLYRAPQIDTYFVTSADRSEFTAVTLSGNLHLQRCVRINGQ